VASATRKSADAPLFNTLKKGGWVNTIKVFSIVSLSFKAGNKWRLSDGHGSAKSVTVHDAEFLEKIDSNDVRFGKGDLLIFNVREVDRRTPKGLKSEYEILRVIEHRPAGENQQEMDF
jgi:hypothetical protein